MPAGARIGGRAVARRAALAGLAFGAFALRRSPSARAAPPRFTHEWRAVRFEPLTYRDGIGRPLGTIRPYSMVDRTGDGGSSPPGWRDIVVRVGVRSFGLAEFAVLPSWFALRDADARLHRPLEVPSAVGRRDPADAFTAGSIPACGSRAGWLAFRVPRDARLEALVLTPSPGPAFLLADLRQEASVVID